MLSIGQSRFALPAQVVFLGANAMGLFLGVVYNAKTPNLYENNAHHKIGWIFSWFAVAWIALAIVKLCGARSGYTEIHSAHELYRPLQSEDSTPDRSWFVGRDQRLGRRSRSSSPSLELMPGLRDRIMSRGSSDPDDEMADMGKHGFLKAVDVEQFLSKIARFLHARRLFVPSNVVCSILERLIVIFGFVALLTGIATFGGIFVRLLLAT